jgi:hypothetical protein
VNAGKFFGEISTDDWRRPSVIALVLANVLPVAGVFLFHWEVFPLMFLFWSENVVIGILNVLRMICAVPFKPGGLPLIPFFCVHYGMFTMVHGAIITELFGGGTKFGPGFSSFWGTYLDKIQENHLTWAILGIAVSRGISFATNYVASGEYRRAKIEELMWQPYGRVILLHIAVLGGGFLMQALHSPVIGLLVLIALKTAFDLRGHLRERRKFAGAPA